MNGLCTERSGVSLVEIVVVIAITSLLSAVLIGTLVAQLELARSAAQRALTNDAVRTTLAVVGGELRRAMPVDIRSLSDESLALRSFRGLAHLCDEDGPVVRYRGDRLPDPTKDSVLVVRVDGEQSFRLTDSRTAAPGGSCTSEPDHHLLRLDLEGGAPTEGATALLVFESGEYHLSTRALRYTLGAGGRQPLTAERFAHPGTAFLTWSGSYTVGIGLAFPDRPTTVHTLPFSPPPATWP